MPVGEGANAHRWIVDALDRITEGLAEELRKEALFPEFYVPTVPKRPASPIATKRAKAARARSTDDYEIESRALDEARSGKSSTIFGDVVSPFCPESSTVLIAVGPPSDDPRIIQLTSQRVAHYDRVLGRFGVLSTLADLMTNRLRISGLRVGLGDLARLSFGGEISPGGVDAAYRQLKRSDLGFPTTRHRLDRLASILALGSPSVLYFDHPGVYASAEAWARTKGSRR